MHYFLNKDTFFHFSQLTVSASPREILLSSAQSMNIIWRNGQRNSCYTLFDLGWYPNDTVWTFHQFLMSPSHSEDARTRNNYTSFLSSCNIRHHFSCSPWVQLYVVAVTVKLYRSLFSRTFRLLSYLLYNGYSCFHVHDQGWLKKLNY